MLVGPAGRGKARHGGGGGKTAAAAPAARTLSPSTSSSNDSVALPTRVVSGRALRRVGRVSDDDFETSSYEETSDSSFQEDNSEEFVPLAFGYINGHPKRSAGAPARALGPTGASEEVGSQSSLSDVSPLEVFFERNNAKRNYGKGARHVQENEITTSLSSFDEDNDDTSAVSDALPVEFERKKRTRSVGKVKDPIYEMSDSQSAVSLSDEDEAPLNAQLIYTLVKRLRNPLDEVTPEAFDYLDFDDEAFKEVLEPLKQIKACIERRASHPMKQNQEIEKQIRAAVQSLPSQKAIAVKVQMVKSRQLRPAQSTNRLYRGGESAEASESSPRSVEILLSIVARLKNPKGEVLLSEFERVDWTDRNFEPVLVPLRQIRAYMEAREVIKGKPAEGPMKGATLLDDKIKTVILSLPADKEMAAKVKAVASRPMSRGPANSEAIRELIARLKDSKQQVPLSAFEELDWNDEKFSRELEPLMRLRAFLEAKECVQKKAGETMMGGTRPLDDKIRTATMSLPAEREMATKVQAVKSRQLKVANGQNGAHFGGESHPVEVVSATKTAVVSAPAEKAECATVRAVRSRPMSRGLTNGEEILNLIKKLKDPEALVTLRAFDELEWNDRNFARELAPLQQIRLYMEAKETLKKVAGERGMPTVEDLVVKIKVAILELPPEKAVAVKIQMLKERDMAPTTTAVKPQVAKVGKLSAPEGKVRKMKDSILISGEGKKKKPKEGQLSASTSQVMQVGAKVIASHQRKYKTKESNALSEPTKTVRRPRNTANRSVSFLKVEEPTAGEIVDQDQVLAETAGPQRLLDEAHSPPTTTRSSPATATPRGPSRVPSRPTKGQERRPRNHRPGNNTVSFSDLPKEAAGAIADEDDKLATEKRKPPRRRRTHKPGHNLSISSLPDLEAGEVVEEPVLPDQPAAREAAVPTAPLKSQLKPCGPKKKRRVRTSSGNRSCSFSDVALDEAVEVPDANAATLKGAAEEPATAAAAAAAAGGAGGVAPPKTVRKLVRRRKPGEAGGSPGLEKNSPTPEKAEATGTGAAVSRAPPSHGKGRRANVTRTRSADASMVEDEANGEIEEPHETVQGPYNPSGKSNPVPERASTTRTKDRDLPAANRTAKVAQKSSDVGSAPRKRRQRLHASKELSISAIPENVPGEIVEDERDTFAETAPTGSLASTMRRSLQSNGAGRAFPLVASGSRRGSMRYGDRPNSSARSSVEGNRMVNLPPNAEPSVMPDITDTSHLPPPQTLRRSTEPPARATKPLTTRVNGGTHIPALRASR